jgi:ABC-type transport system involved in multi-copper enzyme maturation permease subunit
MLFFMFSPVPWNWRSVTDAIAFLFSSLFYGYVFFTAAPYVFTRKQRPTISGLFLIALLVLMMFGWGVSNSGTALRHRDKMVIHYLLMYALVSNEKQTEKLGEGY